MNSFKDLADLDIKLSEAKPRKVSNEYKGNVKDNYQCTDHAAERFYERHLNDTNYELEIVKEHINNLVAEKGIEGYYNQEEKETYVAVPGYGLFIIKGKAMVTFIDDDSLTKANTELYINLLNKGRVK